MSTWLVTGAGRGIGLEMTRQLLARGDRVIAGARNPLAALGLRALESLAQGRIQVVELDVSEDGSVKAAREQVGDQPIDVLVNNAGVIGPDRQSSTDMDFDGFRQALEVNTLGPLRVVQAFLPNLRAARGARIVTLTSRMGSMSYASSDHAAYRASKSAANKLMQALATDLKPEGVTVAALHPGWVRTDMGGPQADVGVEDSARGLIGVIDALDMERTGVFIDHQGQILDW